VRDARRAELDGIVVVIAPAARSAATARTELPAARLLLLSLLQVLPLFLFLLLPLQVRPALLRPGTLGLDRLLILAEIARRTPAPVTRLVHLLQ